MVGRLLLLLLLLLLLPEALSTFDPEDGDDDGDEGGEEGGEGDGEGYLQGLDDADMASHTIELMPGSKEGVIWSVLNGSFIQILNTVSVGGETYWWECRFRKSSRCRFKMTSKVDDDDEQKEDIDKNHEILWMCLWKVHPQGLQISSFQMHV